MKLTGRRESSNVEDRRGLSGGAKAGIGGIGAVIVAALFAWMSGGDPLSAGLQAAQEQMSARTESVNPEEFSEEEQKKLHKELDDRLELGMKRGEGWCAYELWLQYQYGGLGYNENSSLAMRYLKAGVKLGHSMCICRWAESAEDYRLPDKLESEEIAELWLKAVRYSGGDEDALRGLRRQSDTSFLLRHKEEIEKYWQPMYAQLTDNDADDVSDEDNAGDEDDGRYDAWA